MTPRLVSPASARLPRLAPAQNAGGAPVTTIAPMVSSRFDLVHRRDDLVDHRRGQRVAFGGIVEGQRGHTIGTARRRRATWLHRSSGTVASAV